MSLHDEKKRKLAQQKQKRTIDKRLKKGKEGPEEVPKPQEKKREKKPVESVAQSTKLFGALDQVVQNDSLKDVEISLNGKESIKVHRLVLAALSAPLCRKFKDAQGNTLRLENVSNVEAFKKMVDFMYGKKLIVNRENVVSLLTVSCLWKVEGLKRICAEFLVENMNRENAIEALNVSDRLNLPDVAEVAAEYVSRNFSLFNKEFFQKLSDDLFKRIFGRPDLTVPKGDGELAIIKLIFLRASSEEARLDELLESCVRFIDLTEEQIIELACDKDFMTFTRKRLLLDALIMKKLKRSAEKSQTFKKKLGSSTFLKNRKASSTGYFWPFY